MSLKPLPQAVLTAHKLREQAKALLLLADELEASAGQQKPVGSGVFLFGEVKPRKKKGGSHGKRTVSGGMSGQESAETIGEGSQEAVHETA